MKTTQAKYTLPQPRWTITPEHTDSEHWYLIGAPVGGKFFSITGFQGWLGGPKVDRIKGWSIKQAAERAFEIMVSEDLRDKALRAYEARDEVKRAPKQALDKTAAFGTAFHDYAERTAKGEKPRMKDYDKELHGVIRKFKEWWKEEGLEPVAAELRVANPEVGFAGTIDLLARDKEGRLVLLDYKTSKGLWKEVQCQLAAGNNGLYATYGVRASILKGVRFGREDGECESKTVPDESAAFALFEQFVKTRNLYNALPEW